MHSFLVLEKLNQILSFEITHVIIILEHTFQNIQTLTHASEDPEFTLATLPPPALSILFKGKGKQKIDTKCWQMVSQKLWED